MTVKEIAELCGVDETTIQRWIHGDGLLNCKMQLRNKIQSKLKKGSPENPSDYDLDETLAIIGEGGGNKPLAVLLAENAENKNAVALMGDGKSNFNPEKLIAPIEKLLETAINKRISSIEKATNKLEKVLEDPQAEAYRELEKWVRTHLMTSKDKRFDRIWVHNIYKEFTYNTKLRYKISEHEVMYKIALDHPEFELTKIRCDWFFAGCKQM